MVFGRRHSDERSGYGVEHVGEVTQAQQALVESLQGIKKGQVPDRSDWCVQLVENSMGFAAGRFFVQETLEAIARSKSERSVMLPGSRFMLSSHCGVASRLHDKPFRRVPGVGEDKNGRGEQQGRATRQSNSAALVPSTRNDTSGSLEGNSYVRRMDEQRYRCSGVFDTSR